MPSVSSTESVAAHPEKQVVRSREPLIDCQTLALVCSVKAVLLLFAWQTYQVFSDHDFGWLAIWNHWDALIYLDLAQHGYAPAGPHRLWLVFYPLYPWLVRVAAALLRNYLLSAFAVSTIASLAVGLLLQRLVRLDFSARLGRSAVWFLFIFPTSYFLHIGYTESLFLALVLGAFLAARSDDWFLAGVIGALACLTRVNGLLLIPALAFEAWAQYRVRRRFDPRCLWLGIIAFGVGIYLLLNYRVSGDAFAFTRYADEGWHKTLAPPWIGIDDLVYGMQTYSPTEKAMLCVQELLFLALACGGTIWCWLRLRASYAVWMTGNLLLIASTSFISSTPRYLLVFFPLFILFALATARRPLLGAILNVWSILFLGLFATNFILNHWAF